MDSVAILGTPSQPSIWQANHTAANAMQEGTIHDTVNNLVPHFRGENVATAWQTSQAAYIRYLNHLRSRPFEPLTGMTQPIPEPTTTFTGQLPPSLKTVATQTVFFRNASTQTR